jgi:hypothetical protein
MTRPRGEIRMALRDAFALTPEPVTWRTVAEVARVGYQAAQRTVENMARSGELQRVGKDRAAGLYQLADACAPAAARHQQQGSATRHAAELVHAVRSWAEFT